MPKPKRSLENAGISDNSNWYEQFKANHPVITEAASYLPVVGTAMDVYEAVNKPTAGNIFNAAISVGSDILGYRLLKNAGKAYKALKANRRAEYNDLVNRAFSKEYAKQRTAMSFEGDDEYSRYIATMLGTQAGDKIINLFQNKVEKERTQKKDGGTHIAPSKRGTLTAEATKHGMSAMAFAHKVMANKNNYSSKMVKKANFAINFNK